MHRRLLASCVLPLTLCVVAAACGGANELPAPAPPVVTRPVVIASPALAHVVPLPAVKPAAPPAPAAAVGPLPPNEAGRIMVLEYHVFGPQEGRYERTPQGFRRDLEALYQRGYRPVSLDNVLAGRIDLPRGFSPVVLTFDDGSIGQFRYLPDGSVDPASAVGVLLAFHRQHPDWALRGTFYLNGNAFGQPASWQRKLRFLVAQGFSIGDHTFTHPNLGQLDNAAVEAELGQEIAYVRQALPGYNPATMALPFGIMPRDEALAESGSWNGIAYHFRAVMLVGAGPMPSPYDRAFDPYQLPRIQVTDPSLKVGLTFYTWLHYFDRYPDQRFVSDGRPKQITVPLADAGLLRPGLPGVALVKAP